jgi:hypothetical protein
MQNIPQIKQMFYFNKIKLCVKNKLFQFLRRKMSGSSSDAKE